MSDTPQRATAPWDALAWLRATAGGIGLAMALGYFQSRSSIPSFTRGLALLLVLIVMVMWGSRLRRPSASLIGWATRACLAVSALTAIVAILAPPKCTAHFLLVTSAFGAAGVLSTTPRPQVLETLFVVASIGVGLAVIWVGLAVIFDGNWSRGLALIALGVAAIGLAVGAIGGSEWLGGLAVVGGVVAGIGTRVAWIPGDGQFLGLAAVEAGVALSGFAAAAAVGDRQRCRTLSLSTVGFGVALIWLGIAAIREGNWPFGMLFAGTGLALVGAGRTGCSRLRSGALVRDSRKGASDNPRPRT